VCGRPNDEQLAGYERHPLQTWFSADLIGRSFLRRPENITEETSDDYEDVRNDDPELDTSSVFLKPGDIAELLIPNREPVLAAFMQHVDVMDQFLLPNGKWIHMYPGLVHFALPNAIDPKLISPVLPYLPTKSLAAGVDDLHVPRELVKGVTTILQDLRQETDRIYRENAARLDNAHAVLAGNTKLRIVSVTRVARMLLRKGEDWVPSASTILAVRKALAHDRFRFYSRSNSGRMGLIFIRPKEDVEMVERVQSWIREYTEYMASSNSADKDGLISGVLPTEGALNVLRFLEKSRKLIAISRKYRGCMAGGQLSEPSGATLDEGGVEFADEPFTGSDLLLIHFVKAWVLSDQFRAMDTLFAQCHSLLTATGCYEEFGASMATGMLFLQEIGVILPFENKPLHNEQLMLPISRTSRNLEPLHKKVRDLHDPIFDDAMGHLRHDWQGLPVYCIDDVDAKEIDDGVSIQEVSGQEDQFWIHVHVANPTAFLDKTSPIANLAAHLTESVYFPEKSFAMIPRRITQRHFSLAPNRPVLTFSIRLDTSGSIIETKIQNGVIRDVVSLTAEDVAEAVGVPLKKRSMRLVVGRIGERSSPRRSSVLSTAQTQDIKKLYSLALARRRKREETAAISLPSRHSETRVYQHEGQTGSGLTWTPPSVHKPRFIHGDPIIEIEITERLSTFAGAVQDFNMVSELMILACDIAGRWCAERNIPVIFRGTVPQPRSNNLGLTIAQFRTKILEPYISLYDHLPVALGQRFNNMIERAATHTHPRKHQVLAIDNYVKVTSPLRRFGDMIAHWQIEAGLRREAETRVKFGTNAQDHSLLPFSEGQLQEYIDTMIYRETLIAKLKETGNRFWLVQLLFRALYCKELELPDTWRVAVTAETLEVADRFDATILDLDLKGILLKSGEDVQIGDEWEAKITQVHPYYRQVFLEPVRILRRHTYKVSGNMHHLDTVDFQNPDLSRKFEALIL
jgi:exoribonuclease R